MAPDKFRHAPACLRSRCPALSAERCQRGPMAWTWGSRQPSFPSFSCLECSWCAFLVFGVVVYVLRLREHDHKNRIQAGADQERDNVLHGHIELFWLNCFFADFHGTPFLRAARFAADSFCPCHKAASRYRSDTRQTYCVRWPLSRKPILASSWDPQGAIVIITGNLPICFAVMREMGFVSAVIFLRREPFDFAPFARLFVVLFRVPGQLLYYSWCGLISGPTAPLLRCEGAAE